MALNPNRTSADFTFKHTGQPDKFGASKGGVVADIQADLDQRAIDNLLDINNVKDHIRSDLATKTEVATAVFTSVVPDGSVTDTLLSNTAGQIKDVVSGHTGQLAGWKVYNDITELGLAVGSETMELICATMVDKSILRFSKISTNTSTAYPSPDGLLEITRVSGSRVRLKFTDVENGGITNDWFGFYVGSLTPTFSGWKKVSSTVSGTYTGDGTASRTIPLGFTPSAVFLINNEGQITEGGVGGWGGLALTGSPAKYGLDDVVTITTGGFIVYYDTPNDIYSNISGQVMHYIAFR